MPRSRIVVRIGDLQPRPATASENAVNGLGAGTRWRLLACVRSNFPRSPFRSVSRPNWWHALTANAASCHARPTSAISSRRRSDAGSARRLESRDPRLPIPNGQQRPRSARRAGFAAPFDRGGRRPWSAIRDHLPNRQWANAETCLRPSGRGAVSDSNSAVCARRSRSRSSPISWLIPARTTIRNTERSSRLAGKV